MEVNGIQSSSLSEESKKALQSETWQEARGYMREKRKVEHFTTERTENYAYGYTWHQVVQEYLRSGYNAEDNYSDIAVMGKMYKTLRRPEVTVFYDAAGDTLFDVTNERLEKEYEWLMNGGTGDVAQNKDTGEEDSEAVGTSPVARTEEDSGVSKTDAAKKKYEISLKSCMPYERGYFEGPIKEHMLNRFEEDQGFCEDFLQEHKTFQKCIKYMIKKARASVPKSERQAMVDGEIYLEWMEDYFRKDDKVEEEKKAKKEAKEKAKREKSVTERKTAKAKENAGKTEKISALPKSEGPKAPSKPKKNGKEIDGQLDLFAMMGM